MKLLLMVILFFNLNAYAQHKLNINIEPTEELIENILNPIWSTIAYDYELQNKNIYPVLKDTISIELIKSKVSLGPKLHPLFKLNFINNDQFLLNWDLSKLQVLATAKVRFKFKKYGVNITHDEYFEINANSLGPSTTTIGLEFQKPSFKIKLISNSGFKIQNVHVKPKDGIGQLLRFIFDNIFSEEEVDHYLTTSLNNELEKWINKNTLISEIETSLNKEIQLAQNKEVKLSEIANHFKINFDEIKLSKKLLSLSISPKFNQNNLVVHPCADGMLNSRNKDSITSTHSIIETMLNNYNTYEIWDEQKRIQPFVCFGYHDIDQDGNPIGEIAKAQFLGRKIEFKYWVKPEAKPLYEYFPEDQIVKVTLEMNIKIEDNAYPIIRATNNTLKSQLVGFFKIEFDPRSGLNLVFKRFEMPSITGAVKVKWNRFTPAVRVPLNIMRSAIIAYINSTAQDNKETINLIKPEFEFSEGVILEINQYKMTQSNHQIIFTTK